jgi:hypothetical protein
MIKAGLVNWAVDLYPSRTPRRNLRDMAPAPSTRERW